MPDDRDNTLSPLEEIISGIEQSTLANPPRTMSQIEEEMLRGLKPPSMRGGRFPAFYRAEVEVIRADKRGLQEIADSWGVSIDTICRVQMRGRFKNVEYVPRDEVDRRIPYEVTRTHADEPTPYTEVRGRPFKSGRPALTSEEILAIVNDTRSPREIAWEYELTVNYVRKLRIKHGALSNRVSKITPGLVRSIKLDKRTPTEIASAFKVSTQFVKDVRQGRYGGDVISDGDDHENHRTI